MEYWRAAATALLSLFSIFNSTASWADDRDKAADMLSSAAAQAENGDCTSALGAIDALVQRNDFSALGNDAKILAYETGIHCALQVNDGEIAYSYAVKGTQLEGASPYLLRVRLIQEATRHHAVQAVTMAERLASVDRDELTAIPLPLFFQVNRELQSKGLGAPQESLLAILSDPAFVPREIGFDKDYFLRDYAAMLAEKGDLGTAGKTMGRISQASILIRASVDPRLRELVPADFDARAAVEGELARLQVLAAKNPASMNVVTSMAKNLRALGRFEEALALLQGALPEDGSRDSTYSDLDRTRNWWWDALAQVYAGMARYEEAARAFRRGVDAGELFTSKNVNVSQTLNLAGLQLIFGHDDEALKNLSSLDFDSSAISPYGMMVARLMRGCARFRTGDISGANEDRAYAEIHEADGRSQLVDLLLCLGDMDAAAKVAIRRLDDPSTRADALLDLSDFDAPVFPVPTDPTVARQEELKQREDIKAAIARAGGIRRFMLQRSGT